MDIKDLRKTISTVVSAYGDALQRCTQEFLLCYPAKELPYDTLTIARCLQVGMLDAHFAEAHEAFRAGYRALPFFVGGEDEAVVRAVSEKVMPHIRKHKKTSPLDTAAMDAVLREIGGMKEQYEKLLAIHARCAEQQKKAIANLEGFLEREKGADILKVVEETQ
jgi:hypothetical protein